MYNKKRIFTFWEPKDNIPGYLQLCMKTWKKFLPEYKIVVLDYSNLNEWIGENYFDKYLYKNFPLPQQSDAIRVALLKKYGGIWLDVDTIITSVNFKQLLNYNSDLIIIGDSIAFLYANQQSKIIKKWDKFIKKKIELRKKSRNLFNYIFHYSYWRKFKDWAYLGNSILNRINKNKTQEVYRRYNDDEILAKPELQMRNSLSDHSGESYFQIYRKFYFEKDFSNFIMENTKGIIMLHNSWTPDIYKKMSEEEFLKTDNTLSNLFKELLK